MKDVKFDVEGVGSVEVRELDGGNVEVSVEGVGRGEVGVDWEEVDGRIEGVGSVSLSGKGKWGEMWKEGMGRVCRGGLKVGE